MAGKSASLLTKTQRNRIRNDFAELDEQKKHRDQQRIRERVRSGLLDFQLLADYPDHQLALMFDDVSEDELRATLADTTILIERLGEQSEIEREELIEEVRDRIEKCSSPTEDTKTLEQVDLQTAAEIRRQTEDELAEQFEPGRWDKRANSLMKLGISAAILVVLTQFLYSAMNTEVIRSIFRPVLSTVILLLFVSAIGWILINVAQLVKYDILPFLIELSTDPKAAVGGALRKLFKNPWGTIRESWNEL
jgi:hypothetical protein